MYFLILERMLLAAAPPGASPSGLTATGGAISDFSVGATIYRMHAFVGSEPFVVSSIGTYGNEIEYLVVGGGGGGGNSGAAGGGGGGGLRNNLSGHPLAGSSYSVSAGAYTVTVGAGGAKGVQGGNSEFYPTPVGPAHPQGILSHGGGSGAPWNPSPGPTGGPGGSGGGGKLGGSGGSGNTPPFTPSQGNSGGGVTSPNSAGGGGGAGAAGGNGNGSYGGPGGIGSQVLISGPPAELQQMGTPRANHRGGQPRSGWLFFWWWWRRCKPKWCRWYWWCWWWCHWNWCKSNSSRCYSIYWWWRWRRWIILWCR